MFERFNERAIKSIMLAQEEARRLGHAVTEPEHLLLGLICERYGSAGRAVESMGVGHRDARVKLESLVERGTTPVGAEIPFAAQLDEAFSAACAFADQLKHSHVGSGHLLIGLIDVGPKRVVEVLAHFDIDLKELRKCVMKRITEERLKKEENRFSGSFSKIAIFRMIFISMISKLLSLNVIDALPSIVRVVGEVMKLSRCMFVVTDVVDQQWQHYEYWDKTQVQSCTQSGWSAKDSVLVAQTVQESTPLEAVYDRQIDTAVFPEQAELASLGVKSQLGIALRFGDVTFGCLILQQCDEWKAWQPDEIEFVQRVAESVAEALAKVGGAQN